MALVGEAANDHVGRVELRELGRPAVFRQCSMKSRSRPHVQPGEHRLSPDPWCGSAASRWTAHGLPTRRTPAGDRRSR